MNIFQRTTTWSNAELWLYKLAVFAAGLLFGMYGQQYLDRYADWLWFATVILLLIVTYLWAIKMKGKRTKPGVHARNL